MKFADRLKARRKKLGLSADEIADKIGKNQATIHRYESGDIENIPINVVVPLAKVLMTTPDWLMGWDEEPDTKPVDTVVKTTLKLKTLREENKKTMAQVARDLGIPYTTYVNYEKGEREPNFNTLISLAEYFNCSIDNLFARGKQENLHEAVLKAVESVLKEYLSDTLTASIMEEISKKINKSG